MRCMDGHRPSTHVGERPAASSYVPGRAAYIKIRFGPITGPLGITPDAQPSFPLHSAYPAHNRPSLTLALYTKRLLRDFSPFYKTLSVV